MRTKINILSCNFSQNSASFYGGSIYLYKTGNLLLENNLFYKNSAKYGGAIYYFEDGKNIYIMIL